MQDISVELAQLVAIFLQSILYGLYLVTCGYCFSRFLRHASGWLPRRDIEWRIILVGFALWAIATLNLALGILRLIQGVLTHQGSRGGNEIGRPWITTAKVALMCFQIIIADSIMVWRLWVIYERSLLASVIPTLLWAGGLVITIWTVYLRIHVAYRPGATEEDYPPELHAICMALWALTISLNLYTTSAIVLRIWRADRETKACLRASQFNRDIQPPSYLKQTMKIVIESGLIHSAVTVSVFICLALRTNASYITTAIDIIVIGITFNLIVLRVASRRLRESHAKQSSVDFVTSSTLNGYLAETGSCASSLRSRDGPIQSPSIGDGRPVVHIDPLDGQERQPQPHV